MEKIWSDCDTGHNEEIRTHPGRTQTGVIYLEGERLDSGDY